MQTIASIIIPTRVAADIFTIWCYSFVKFEYYFLG